MSCLLGYSIYVYGCSNERGETEDLEEESEVFGGGERVEIPWPLCMLITWFCVASRNKT